MFISEGSQITRKEARYFLEPANATHRQYEALRAFFVEGLSAAQVAQRFGYTPGTVRVMVPQFRQTPERPFFQPPAKGPQAAPKSDPLRDRIVALRKQNLSIYDSRRALTQEGPPLSAVALSQILRQEGFARLPRRPEEERPSAVRPTVAAVADVRQLDLPPRTIRTQLGGLFLFVPLLAQIPLERICSQARLPGSQMIPASCALRSLLGLKLFGTARHGHVMSAVLDEGLALFAGRNVIPKRSFRTEYSCRIDPACYGRWMHRGLEAVSTLGLPRGESFDLDFHTIPFHGEDALLEKHYVTKRSRRQKGILAFLAREDQTRVSCYANGQLRKEQQNDEILRFVDFWKQRTGRYPEELIFDSKLTTYANLSRLNDLGIRFLTRRRRSPKLLREIATIPASAWRRIELEGVRRLYKTPRILDRQITLSDYEGLLRQMTILDLGHEEPTLLLTNQLRRSPAPLIERYARRMLIENQIADGIDFFHMDALSSAVAMKVNCDLQLTLMASSLYRLLGVRIGHGYETAKSRHLFRDFINATATIKLGEKEVQVTFAERAHNPLLPAAGWDQTEVAVPWLGNRRLKLAFG